MGDKLCVEAYKPLIEEIEILEIRIEGLEREKELILKKMKRGPGEINSIAYDGMPKGNQEHKSLLIYVEDVQRLDNLIYLDKEILRVKKETLNRIEDKVKKFTGLEHKIAIRLLKGKTLKEIAEELGYSYDWIREVNSKMKTPQ